MRACEDTAAAVRDCVNETERESACVFLVSERECVSVSIGRVCKSQGCQIGRNRQSIVPDHLIFTLYCSMYLKEFFNILYCNSLSFETQSQK